VLKNPRYAVINNIFVNALIRHRLVRSCVPAQPSSIVGSDMSIIMLLAVTCNAIVADYDM
jgi:hypothetical protein